MCLGQTLEDGFEELRGERIGNEGELLGLRGELPRTDGVGPERVIGRS